jgi:hypothetical protein
MAGEKGEGLAHYLGENESDVFVADDDVNYYEKQRIT